MAGPRALFFVLPSLFLGVAALGGCSSLGGGIGNGDRTRIVSYRCDDGRQFNAVYSPDGDRVTVDTGKDTYRLRSDGSGLVDRTYSGADGMVHLVSSGSDADLKISGDPDFKDCRTRS
jgi:hypothetical protein